MNKLYLLGALALSNVEAYINAGTTAAKALPTTGGSYTYTVTTDCFLTATATTLGMNNIFHQYYTFALLKGAVTYSSFTYSTSPAATTIPYAIYAYTGCFHSHLYNWLAQPQMTTVTALSGLSSATVAYGYAMSGTAITACTVGTAVTTTLYKTNIFSGAQFQGVTSILNPSSGVNGVTTASTTVTTLNTMLQTYGTNSLYTAAVTIQAYVAGAAASMATLGVVTTSAQNAYWDFMQTNVYQGSTQFGRGGGASTAPCGWWVVYTYEAPGAQNIDTTAANLGTPITTWNLDAFSSGVTINMWTDNGLLNTLSAFVLASLAVTLY